MKVRIEATISLSPPISSVIHKRTYNDASDIGKFYFQGTPQLSIFLNKNGFPELAPEDVYLVKTHPHFRLTGKAREQKVKPFLDAVGMEILTKARERFAFTKIFTGWKITAVALSIESEEDVPLPRGADYFIYPDLNFCL